MADYIVAASIDKVAKAIESFAYAASRYVTLQERLASKPIPQYQCNCGVSDKVED